MDKVKVKDILKEIISMNSEARDLLAEGKEDKAATELFELGFYCGRVLDKLDAGGFDDK